MSERSASLVWCSTSDSDGIQRTIEAELRDAAELNTVMFARDLTLALAFIDSTRFRDRGSWAVIVSQYQCVFAAPDKDVPSFVAHCMDGDDEIWIYGVYTKAPKKENALNNDE